MILPIITFITYALASFTKDSMYFVWSCKGKQKVQKEFKLKTNKQTKQKRSLKQEAKLEKIEKKAKTRG